MTTLRSRREFVRLAGAALLTLATEPLWEPRRLFAFPTNPLSPHDIGWRRFIATGEIAAGEIVHVVGSKTLPGGRYHVRSGGHLIIEPGGTLSMEQGALTVVHHGGSIGRGPAKLGAIASPYREIELSDHHPDYPPTYARALDDSVNISGWQFRGVPRSPHDFGENYVVHRLTIGSR